ncbi:Adk1, partial [Drosophila busckii]
LFMCHQKTMKREAQEKLKAEQLRKAQAAAEIPIIWILGGPGSGKGTQCAKIVEKYGFTHLSSGDLLRDEVASGSDKGRQLQAIMTSGGLVPNEEVLSLLNAAVSRAKGNSKGFLIDGYPREKSQGIAFEQTIAPCDLVIYFECSEESMVKRIMNRAAAAAVKRADDNEETIRARLHTFKMNTSEILALYADKTMTINAERDVEDIFMETVNIINCLMQKKAKASASC